MDDLISRQEAIDAVDAIGHIATMPDGDKCIRRSAVKYTLSMLPSAQSEQKTATWLIRKWGDDAKSFNCKRCKECALRNACWNIDGGGIRI